MQFTDLVLCVLAQFPESPERCHFSPAHRRRDTATAGLTKGGWEGGRGAERL